MKRSVLVMLDAYLPGFRAGGPIKSVSALVESLGSEFAWHIICPDRDLGDDAPYPGVMVDQWTRVGQAAIYYASPRMLRPWNLLHLLRGCRYDMLYLNSFFSPRMSVLPAACAYVGLLRQKPVLIAPRGEFSPGALAIKAWKKRPYLGMARLLGLYKACYWHLSTTRELDDLHAVFDASKGTSFVARNSFVVQDMIPAAPSRPSAAGGSASGSSLSVAFLSRISPMKNLDFALRALAQVRAPIVFSVFGPEEDAGYVSLCRKLAQSLPANVEVRWCGAVPAAEVVETLSAHDLLLLPTRGENFGHVFVEAWLAGVPVLISDQTPWRGLEQQGVGWDLPLESAERFAEVIDQVAAWPQEKRRSVAKACREKAGLLLNDDGARQANRSMFEAVLAGRRK